MKVATTVLALTLTTTAAFQQAATLRRHVSSALAISKEEDLELTRKVIFEFGKAQGGEAPAAEPEPEAKKEKEPVAAKED